LAEKGPALLLPYRGYGKGSSHNGKRALEGVSFESAAHHHSISLRLKTTAFEKVTRDYYIIESNTIATLSSKRSRIATLILRYGKRTFRLSSGEVFDYVLPFAKRWIDLGLKGCASAQQTHCD